MYSFQMQRTPFHIYKWNRTGIVPAYKQPHFLLGLKWNTANDIRCECASSQKVEIPLSLRETLVSPHPQAMKSLHVIQVLAAQVILGPSSGSL